MKVGIMQPYFFPYIGYWQLINTVDSFVIYDDVNFIKQGWINRNSIISTNDSKESIYRISMQLMGASSFKLINEINIGNNLKKILKTIEQVYIKAPYFESTFPIFQDILTNNEKNLARFLNLSINIISDFLDINTNIIISSDLGKDNNLKGQDKVISICEILEAKQYINSSGGRELYNKGDFSSKGIGLNFIKTEIIEYPQFNHDFIPNLSIIDVMMFNSQEDIKSILDKYTLI